MSVPLISCENLEYSEPGNPLLREVTFRLERGQRGVLLAEPHRCATILLKICATLMQPTGGEIRWFGRGLNRVKGDEIYELRRRIGLVHRESSLISNMSVLDNVTLGLQYRENIVGEPAHERATELLKQLDLYDERFLRPAQLTFEKRRLAVYTRELLKKPDIFLLEHPSLDLGEGYYGVLMEIFRVYSGKNGCAFLVASLKPEIMRRWGDWVLILDPEKCSYMEAGEFDPALHAESARRRAEKLSRERRTE